MVIYQISGKLGEKLFCNKMKPIQYASILKKIFDVNIKLLPVRLLLLVRKMVIAPQL